MQAKRAISHQPEGKSSSDSLSLKKLSQLCCFVLAVSYSKSLWVGFLLTADG